jgi:Amidohydrolase family
MKKDASPDGVQVGRRRSGSGRASSEGGCGVDLNTLERYERPKGDAAIRGRDGGFRAGRCLARGWYLAVLGALALQTMGEAYEVAALAGWKLDALRAFHLATLGSARALRLDDRIGRLAPGTEADVIGLDPAATPLRCCRTGFCESSEELQFVLMTLGGDKAVRATRVAGEPACGRDRRSRSCIRPPEPPPSLKLRLRRRRGSGRELCRS